MVKKRIQWEIILLLLVIVLMSVVVAAGGSKQIKYYSVKNKDGGISHYSVQDGRISHFNGRKYELITDTRIKYKNGFIVLGENKVKAIEEERQYWNINNQNNNDPVLANVYLTNYYKKLKDEAKDRNKYNNYQNDVKNWRQVEEEYTKSYNIWVKGGSDMNKIPSKVFTYLYMLDAHREEISKSATPGFIMSLISPSMGQQKVAGWLKKWANSADITFGLSPEYEKGKGKFWIDFSGLGNAASDAICQSKASSYFVPTGPTQYNGINGWPSPQGQDLMFIYGKKLEYSGDITWPEGKFKWFPKADGTPLGYLYTFSWSFKHPYTKDEFDKMDSKKIEKLGLEKNTGSIAYRIIMKGPDGPPPGARYKTSTKGKVWFVKPGALESHTISFYSKNEISGVYIQFQNGYRRNGEMYFPKDRDCKNNIGCVIKVDSDVSGTVIDPTTQSSNYAGQLVTGSVGVGESTGSGDGGSNDDTDYPGIGI